MAVDLGASFLGGGSLRKRLLGLLRDADLGIFKFVVVDIVAVAVTTSSCVVVKQGFLMKHDHHLFFFLATDEEGNWVSTWRKS